MTDTAGPFDGTPWAEAQWARHGAVWAPSGVYGPPAASTSTGDLPLSVSGRSVGLGAGRAWVRGFGFERTGAAVMQDPGANTHASFSRRDRIVLRRNLATHTITQVVIQGTPAGSPAAPALTQSDAGSWDVPTFSFLVPPNSGTGITGLVDERAWVNPDGGVMRDRVITRNHTPVAPGIPSGNFRESGVADGPSIAPFTLYTAGTALVVATFRLGVAAVNTGYVTFQLKIDGVAVADGVARTTDESRMIHAAVALTAGSHTVAVRAQAVGGDATWDSARITVTEGAAE